MFAVTQRVAFVAILFVAGALGNSTALLDWKDNCPAGFDAVATPGLHNVCLRLETAKRTFAEASAFCRSNKSTLVIAHNRDEFLRLLTYVRRTKSSYSSFFVGARRVGTGLKNFFWLDGTKATEIGYYAPWAAGEPNNGFGGYEHCLGVYHPWFSNTVNDFRCYTEMEFVCEHRL